MSECSLYLTLYLTICAAYLGILCRYCAPVEPDMCIFSFFGIKCFFIFLHVYRNFWWQREATSKCRHFIWSNCDYFPVSYEFPSAKVVALVTQRCNHLCKIGWYGLRVQAESKESFFFHLSIAKGNISNWHIILIENSRFKTKVFSSWKEEDEEELGESIPSHGQVTRMSTRGEALVSTPWGLRSRWSLGKKAMMAEVDVLVFIWVR